jgi:hypothetical protein
MLDLEKLIRLVVSLALFISIHSWVCVSFPSTCRFRSSHLLHTDIGSFLLIPFRSLLIHAYHTRSVVVFCIGRALPIRRVRVIRKSSRYSLVFDSCCFLVNLHVKLTDTPLFESSAVRAVRYLGNFRYILIPNININFMI